MKGHPIDKKDNDLLAACIQAGMGMQAAEVCHLPFLTMLLFNSVI